jgi:hypothetical protein
MTSGVVKRISVCAARAGKFLNKRIRCRLMDTATNSSPPRVAAPVVIARGEACPIARHVSR